MVSTALPGPGHKTTRKLPRLPIGALAAEAAAVLWDAERWGLPQPHYVTVSDTQNISFQFADDPASFAALARWHGSFGGTIATMPICRDNGDPAMLCRVKFSYHDRPAEAYAVVTAETAS